jgi:hypothetical protein
MSEYDKLFTQYVLELRETLVAANAWWEDLQRHERDHSLFSNEVNHRLETRWPFGVASHPWVLGVYRKYYLLVQQLNDRLVTQNLSSAAPQEADWGTDNNESDQRESESIFEDGVPIAQWMFLLDALHGRHNELANVITMIIYQPVGLDSHDRAI